MSLSQKPLKRAEIITPVRSEKSFATLQAMYAIAGHALYKTANESGKVVYLVSRWGHIRELITMQEVEQFLAQIGGAK